MGTVIPCTVCTKTWVCIIHGKILEHQLNNRLRLRGLVGHEKVTAKTLTRRLTVTLLGKKGRINYPVSPNNKQTKYECPKLEIF